MNRLGDYNDYQMNVEASAAFLCEAKAYNILAAPITPAKETTGEAKNFQEYLCNASGIDIEEMTWGRVVQKGKVSAIHETPVSRQEGKKVVQIGNDTFLCAFVETSSAVELFEKERNMDRRNVEQRTFSTGGTVFDFTV